MKLVPTTVSENALAPAIAVLGASEDTEGTGLAEVIVKVAAPEMPPPGAGVVTVTATEPAVMTSDAGTWAVSCEALTKVVGSATPPQLTYEEDTKFVPLTVSTNAPVPATTLVGLSADTAGVGLEAVTTSVAAPDVPPPGAGLTTVTLAEVAVATSDAGICAVSDVDDW